MLGGNFTEYMLDAAVKCEELNDILTGLYRAQIIYEEDRQYLAFDLEIQQSISPDQAIIDRVYYSLMESLGQLESAFLSGWRRVYSAWDNDTAKRILRLNFIPWPGLSKSVETSIKQRGIIN
jgi:phenylacetate-CoA ligase